MILEHFGELSTAQDLTAGSTDSENVIYMPATDYTAITDLWWVVDTETVATGDGSDTYQFQLVMSQEATLDTNIQILSRTITGYASSELATAGNRIIGINFGTMLIDTVDNSSYPYLGIISTISTGATVSVNIAISPSKPPTKYNSQTLRSNVTVPS